MAFIKKLTNLSSTVAIWACGVALLWVPQHIGAVEFQENFESPCGAQTCGCSNGCGRPNETPYRFDGTYFRTHDGAQPYWSQSTHEIGTGINGSECFKSVSEGIGPASQASCYFEKAFANDGDIYVRGCWKFGPTWDDFGLADQKLYYIYFASEIAGYGPNLTLFWHAGSTDNGWAGDGLELALYSIPGDWCHANAANNEVQHTNHLKLADHTNEWMCLEVHEDVANPTWTRTIWVTTQTGAQNLAANSAQEINGVMHFNDYLYARQTIAGAAQEMTSLKFGSYANESVGGGSEMWLDELVISDLKIGHPFVTDQLAPAAPQNLLVQ